jgi:protein-L-isoaspartate(D-aspartate) O-methyltransferase
MAVTALQRKNMVESQIRPSDVTDRRIMAAMATIPREAFVPQQLQSFAYSDETLTIAAGRMMLAPRLLAKLVQLADVKTGDKALVVGGCCGYAAAVLAQLAAEVVALVPDSASEAATRAALATAGASNVTVAAGPLAAGWSAKAPYDLILVEGGTESIPEELQSQLGDGGRLAAIGIGHGIGRAFLLHKNGALITRRDDFQASAPLLSGFEAVRPAFVF